jgi:hypothetical protein
MIYENAILILTDFGGRHYWKYSKERTAPAVLFIEALHRKNQQAFLSWKGAGQFILKPTGRGLYVLEKIIQKKIKHQAFWLEPFDNKAINPMVKKIAKEHQTGRIRNSDKKTLDRIFLAANSGGRKWS